MKITFDWLKDHLKTNLKEKNLLEQLTNVGLEVEGVQNLSADKELFKVASSPEEMLSLGHDKIYNYIKSCGLAPKKTKAIVETSEILINQLNAHICIQ
jgi:endonuclease III